MRVCAVDLQDSVMKVTYLLGQEEDLSKLTNSSADDVELVFFGGDDLHEVQRIKIAGVMLKGIVMKADARVTQALMAHFTYAVCGATLTHDAGKLPVEELHVDAGSSQEIEIVYSHKGVSFLPKS